MSNCGKFVSKMESCHELTLFPSWTSLCGLPTFQRHPSRVLCEFCICFASQSQVSSDVISVFSQQVLRAWIPAMQRWSQLFSSWRSPRILSPQCLLIFWFTSDPSPQMATRPRPPSQRLPQNWTIIFTQLPGVWSYMTPALGSKMQNRFEMYGLVHDGTLPYCCWPTRP